MLIFLIGIGIIGILLLYQVFECPHQFVEHPEGVAVDAEILVDLQGSEVQSEAAVVAARDRDVLASEDVGIAFRAPGHGLGEGEVLVVIEFVALDVAAQDALIVLAALHSTVAAEDGFQIHGQFRVAVPALEHLFYNASHGAGLT